MAKALQIAANQKKEVLVREIAARQQQPSQVDAVEIAQSGPAVPDEVMEEIVESVPSTLSSAVDVMDVAVEDVCEVSLIDSSVVVEESEDIDADQEEPEAEAVVVEADDNDDVEVEQEAEDEEFQEAFNQLSVDIASTTPSSLMREFDEASVCGGGGQPSGHLMLNGLPTPKGTKTVFLSPEMQMGVIDWG